MIEQLRVAIEHSDLTASRQILSALLQSGGAEPWAVHEGIYPVVQRVLNPPFINPHLAKMYAINREIAGHLGEVDVALLVGVEVEEYTRREKLPYIEKPADLPPVATFAEVEQAFSHKDSGTAASAMAGYLKAAGARQFARRLLLLGSGYLDCSLGHSISCTAFILLDMIRRKDQDCWPALVLLADYFCKGGFTATPVLRSSTLSADACIFEVQRAVSGKGIVPLHHVITLYAIERSRHFFELQEYDHALAMWAEMMGSKEANLVRPEDTGAVPLPDSPAFFRIFSQKDGGLLLPIVAAALSSREERDKLCRAMIKGVLQWYNGNYNPHTLTGLGSALWLVENFHQHPEIVLTGWLQYLDYFFSEIS